MKKFLSGAAVAAASLAFATAALAVGPPYCEDHATPTITAPDAGLGAACQKAITKNTQKYLKTLVSVRSKCLALGDYEACPNTDDDTKVQTAAGKASAAIAAACGDSSGLNNSYATASAENIGSCTLSQNHGSAEVYVSETNGAGVTTLYGLAGGAQNTIRLACQAGLAKSSQKYLPSLLKIVDKCIETRIKKNDVATLGASCVGSISGGVYTPPSDPKVALSITKLNEKLVKDLTKACAGIDSEQITFLTACPGATSQADLEACIKCSGLNAVFEIVDQQYDEDGSVIVPAAGAIQAAVNAGGEGDKFLIATGTYDEGITLPTATCSVTGETCPANNKCGPADLHPGDACTTNADCNGDTCNASCSAKACGPLASNANAACTVDGDCTGDTCNPAPSNVCESDGDDMQFVGCGAATDDRPRVLPPTMGAPTRGFLAVGVDGLHFQGIEVVGWANDGIFVSGADGVSFRDLLGDGDNLSTPATDALSTYAIFPVKSSNVMVETSEVVNVRDAGIYVGQSDGVVMRHNRVYDCVSGMELENSLRGTVYGNITFHNTGGLLVFKLNGPEHQTSGFHHVFDNVTYDNDVPNFAIPGTTVAAVPRGTGMMIISEDNSVFENNTIAKNDTYGMLVLDQDMINNLVMPPPFVPTSPDQATSNLSFINNWTPTSSSLIRNGTNAEPGTPYPGQWTWAINTPANGTCWTPQPTGQASIIGVPTSFPSCP